MIPLFLRTNMKLKHRYNIIDVAVLPTDATFIIQDCYAKEEDGLLYIWNMRCLRWVCKHQSLAEFNDYWVMESHEYTLGQIVYVELKSSRAYRGGFKTYGDFEDVEYCVYRDWDDNYKISLFKAIPKGFKGPEKKTRYSGGECVTIRKELYPQLDTLVGDQILMVQPVSKGTHQ